MNNGESAFHVNDSQLLIADRADWLIQSAKLHRTFECTGFNGNFFFDRNIISKLQNTVAIASSSQLDIVRGVQ